MPLRRRVSHKLIAKLTLDTTDKGPLQLSRSVPRRYDEANLSPMAYRFRSCDSVADGHFKMIIDDLKREFVE